MATPRILVVDDEPAIRRTLRDLLEMQDYAVDEARDGIEGTEMINANSYDVVLLDIQMPRKDGLAVLSDARAEQPELPIIMLTGNATVETAVEATRLGAFDFLQKPPQLNRLLLTVRNASERGKLEVHQRRTKARVARGAAHVPPMLGDSPAMRRVKQLLERAAPSDARILVTGEAGTGKELVAKWVHHLSPRNSQPLVAVNCAAIPAELIESELFGHEKGAFTGATRQQIGTFEQADGGTLFLDEIGDMSPSAQAKVLRALQENTIKRVGGDRDIRVDVRVVAATNKDLEAAMDSGDFREDLYHRLGVIHIHMPALRDRLDDVALIANLFCEQLSAKAGGDHRSFTDGAMKRLKTFPWRGNVRELHNAVERLLVLSPGTMITEDDVDLFIRPGRRTSGSINDLVDQHDHIAAFRDAAEKSFLERKLTQFSWNISQTSEAIQLQRSNLYAKIKRYGIEKG